MMTKIINLAKNLITLNLIFYVIYNSWFGWNSEPTELELIFDKIFLTTNIISLCLYIIPAAMIYETFVKTAEEIAKKNKNH